jgi:hypothetical protein
VFYEKKKVFSHLKSKHSLPEGYEENFRKANLTFLHQRVFDPITKTIVHLTPLPENLSKEEVIEFLGPYPHHFLFFYFSNFFKLLFFFNFYLRISVILMVIILLKV